MPIYEYQCDSCNNRFEVLQRPNDHKTAGKCPKCGALDIKKRFSSFAAMGIQKEVTADNAT